MIQSKVLKSILTGEAIPCGSGMFQTADGSQFLGKPSEAAIEEAKRLVLDETVSRMIQDACIDFLLYIGEVGK